VDETIAAFNINREVVVRSESLLSDDDIVDEILANSTDGVGGNRQEQTKKNENRNPRFCPEIT
jgi:hypothetical protein